jgi:peroxiredoxin
MNPLKAFRLAGVALIAIVAAWAGVRVYWAFSAPAASRAIRTPVGEVSPPTASDLAADLATSTIPSALKIPDRLPEFSLEDREGKSTSIDTWRGQSLIINFWATWCEPCRREIPLLESLNREWSNRGMTVVGIAVDHRAGVRRFADELKIGYPILIGEEDALLVAKSLGVDTPVFPFSVFTDSRQDVVALYVGELHPPQAKLILAVVQNLNENQVDLAVARRTIAAGLQRLAREAPR